MAAVEVILLQRVEKLGQMGEIVKVKPGFARNYLLPQKKAMRATKENRERFEHQRVELEAQNLKRREEAQRVALGHPIKTLGLSEVRVVLHPEVTIGVIVNVARSAEEAERQARGEAAQPEAEVAAE